MEHFYPEVHEPVGKSRAGKGKKHEEEGKAKCCALSIVYSPNSSTLCTAQRACRRIRTEADPGRKGRQR